MSPYSQGLGGEVLPGVQGTHPPRAREAVPAQRHRLRARQRGGQDTLPVCGQACPVLLSLPGQGDLPSPLGLFFLRIEARTRSGPKWACWCRWERASWNQSPVRVFSCPGSVSEARSLLEEGRGCCCHFSTQARTLLGTEGPRTQQLPDWIPVLEELRLWARPGWG